MLSGGLDSVAALHWSKKQFVNVRALNFSYGQPHVKECTVAQDVAQRLGIPFESLHLGESVRGHRTLHTPTAGMTDGVSNANLSARNVIFLAVAAAYGSKIWKSFNIVIGVNKNDSVGFPDCRPSFLYEMEGALSLAVRGVSDVRILSPWIQHDKKDIVKWCLENEAYEDIKKSISCYAGVKCGVCDACKLRELAFAGNSVEDGNDTIKIIGGDPHREHKKLHPVNPG